MNNLPPVYFADLTKRQKRELLYCFYSWRGDLLRPDSDPVPLARFLVNAIADARLLFEAEGAEGLLKHAYRCQIGVSSYFDVANPRRQVFEEAYRDYCKVEKKCDLTWWALVSILACRYVNYYDNPDLIRIGFFDMEAVEVPEVEWLREDMRKEFHPNFPRTLAVASILPGGGAADSATFNRKTSAVDVAREATRLMASEGAAARYYFDGSPPRGRYPAALLKELVGTFGIHIRTVRQKLDDAEWLTAPMWGHPTFKVHRGKPRARSRRP